MIPEISSGVVISNAGFITLISSDALMTTIPVYAAMGRIDRHIFVDPNGDK